MRDAELAGLVPDFCGSRGWPRLGWVGGSRAGPIHMPPDLRPGARTMRGIKPSLAMAAVGVVGLAIWAGAYVDQTGSRMATAAGRFLAALDDAQANQTTFPFDSEE